VSAGQQHVYRLPEWIASNALAFQTLCACASRRLKEKLEGGLRESSPVGLRIVHTAPHHDDIMLSYHSAMHAMLGRQPATHSVRGNPTMTSNDDLQALVQGQGARNARSGSNSSYRENALGERFNGNINHFAYLTSGFHSVNEDFLVRKVTTCLSASPKRGDTMVTVLEECVRRGDLSLEYDDLMSEFHAAFVANDESKQEEIENVIFLVKVAEVWKISLTLTYAQLIAALKEKLEWIQHDYLCSHQPGDAVPREMQLLKGCMRESEVDRVWALSRIPMNRVHHLRSK
jgi:hypothetical protein